MTKLHESDLEELCIELLVAQGYTHLSPEQQEAERTSFSEVVLESRLRVAIDRLNPNIPTSACEYAVKQVINLPNQGLAENNEIFHGYLTEGVPVEYQKDGNAIGGYIRLVDFTNPKANDLLVASQFIVQQDNITKRPDLILLVNGLPLVVIELKNPTDENATTKKAFTQLQNYKKTISNLFHYNGVLIISDGLDAKAGSLTAGWSRFMQWKIIDAGKEVPETTPQIETMVRGMLRPEVLLDIIKNFTVIEKAEAKDKKTGLVQINAVKKITSYHQYRAVNKAIESTKSATGEIGNRKAGVVWHTQGSGKSLSMVFYVAKIVQALSNPTILVITDRNDLDDQLFDTFAGCKQLLRQKPMQAQNRKGLVKLLKTTGGGIVFSTIQKFYPEQGSTEFDLLSDRKNIIVIADEAHRSQYGFAAIEQEHATGMRTKYGNAKYLRDALPNASFIGFTGTPIENEDRSTPAVFGDYVDIYDIAQAVEDGATVPIYYESRLAKVHLKEDEKEKLNAEVDSITEGEESIAMEKAKAKWTQIAAIVGHKDRLADVAKDFVQHFETRQDVFEGKAMFVAMSRRIAVELYEEIIKLRPKWHATDLQKGIIKVVMTSSSSDPINWQPHRTAKQDRKAIGERLKNPNDSLEIVIVRDMWLTGFDAPCLHTLYVDKLMGNHNLMQAIARVNRVYKDKPGGLVVDYIGIASDLKRAMATYTDGGGKDAPKFDPEEAVTKMLEKFEVVSQFFEGFDFKRYFSAETQQKMSIILESQEFILGLPDGKNRFTKEVGLLSKAFALSVPHPKAMKRKEEIGFFQAVKARLVKFEPSGSGKSDEEIETTIRQLVNEAVVADGVIDIFEAAGIKKPDISILSDDFLEELQGMQRKNIALELLKKLLNDEIKSREKRNFIQGKKLSEMLEAAIKKYQNNLLTATQILEELVEIAKKVRASDERSKDLGLTEYEIAFYDALVNNDSAEKILRDDTLRELARALVKTVQANASIDWTLKESVQAKLRILVKRTLQSYGYPPDKEKLAIENILNQAGLLADEWSGGSAPNR